MTNRLKRYILRKHGRNFLISNYLRVRTVIVARRRAADIEGYVDDFVSDLRERPSEGVTVCYNNAFSPPTFGDFLGVLMLARFLALSGRQLRFVVIDLKREVHWSFLDHSEQESFVSQQIDLARNFLPEGTRIDLFNSLSTEDTGLSEYSKMSVGNVLSPKGEEFYRVAPYFLHVLITKHKWAIPQNFLLSEAKADDREPYVAWHVRRGLWDTRRNSTDSSILEDFAQIKRFFPKHSIMIFSDVVGLQAVSSILTGQPEAREFILEGVKITPQPKAGFIAAIPLLLAADFYYQRGGGGVGMIAVYSNLPYLEICPDFTSFFGKHGDKLVPWASENQIFHQTWADIESFSVERLMSISAGNVGR